MKVLAILILLISQLYAQTTYKVPFSSKGNSIELTVKNTSQIKTEGIEVKITGKPEWIKFENEAEKVEVLEGGTEKGVEFKFSVDKSAPVGEKTKLKFQITNNRGESWEKEITVEVSPPEKFELYQNYPNPFNPSTTITYTIPASETLHATSQQLVQLKIYDILGREVATLVNQLQKPGFYKAVWNANNYASGMYIYQLIAKGKNGEIKIQRKKLLLMK